MPDYRRWYVPGGTVFFTVVTYQRQPIFADPEAGTLLGTAIRTVRDELPWTTLAMVLLPDHLHAIWQLPTGDDDYSTRWKRIKSRFSTDWRCSGRSQPKVRVHDRREASEASGSVDSGNTSFAMWMIWNRTLTTSITTR